jgi:hypothetical protein
VCVCACGGVALRVCVYVDESRLLNFTPAAFLASIFLSLLFTPSLPPPTMAPWMELSSAEAGDISEPS